MHGYPYTLAAYPPASHVPHLKTGLHGIAPHRVYLVSLQHYLYILSAALVLKLKIVSTGVTRYAMLWCPDFPLFKFMNSDKAVCCAKIEIAIG